MCLLTDGQVRVVDAPRVAYRAVMIDVARNFLDKHFIFRLLDVMAMYKMNALHLHLTDDQGWRLQVPTLPELTDVGLNMSLREWARFRAGIN